MSNEEEIAEPIELTRRQSYTNVYENLKGQDIKPWVEKKKVSNTFQPDFLSWTHVWEFLLQTYPDFDLDYLDPIKHDDGTVTVQCRLYIPVNDHLLARTERLYVMDNKMNALKNPSAQAINKAEKRCFVKCAALFGLVDSATRLEIGRASREWAVQYHGRRAVAKRCVEMLKTLNIP